MMGPLTGWHACLSETHEMGFFAGEFPAASKCLRLAHLHALAAPRRVNISWGVSAYLPVCLSLCLPVCLPACQVIPWVAAWLRWSRSCCSSRGRRRAAFPVCAASRLAPLLC